MNIDHVRDTFSNRSITGTVAVDGVHECFVLENPLKLNPELGPEHLAIPYGSYPVHIRYSPRFKRRVIELKDVPGRTCIEIHPGNNSFQTHGCLLPGLTRGKDLVINSAKAEAALFVKVVLALERGEDVRWHIRPIDLAHAVIVKDKKETA